MSFLQKKRTILVSSCQARLRKQKRLKTRSWNTEGCHPSIILACWAPSPRIPVSFEIPYFHCLFRDRFCLEFVVFLVLLCFQFCLEAIAVLFGLVFSVVWNSIGLIAVSSPSHGKAIATAAPNDCKAIVNALQRHGIACP